MENELRDVSPDIPLWNCNFRRKYNEFRVAHASGDRGNVPWEWLPLAPGFTTYEDEDDGGTVASLCTFYLMANNCITNAEFPDHAAKWIGANPKAFGRFIIFANVGKGW